MRQWLKISTKGKVYSVVAGVLFLSLLPLHILLAVLWIISSGLSEAVKWVDERTKPWEYFYDKFIVEYRMTEIDTTKKY